MDIPNPAEEKIPAAINNTIVGVNKMTVNVNLPETHMTSKEIIAAVNKELQTNPNFVQGIDKALGGNKTASTGFGS